ncbi:hypothetical protein GLOIN_2v1763198 [Rhizophagus irregularis DAOM 181602=DAOM 197198]|nr:hypothetical protein GLOIN_2v1763198 [Rhizophagus irregularis DAOM 181602=DAOM 197198]
MTTLSVSNESEANSTNESETNSRGSSSNSSPSSSGSSGLSQKFANIISVIWEQFTVRSPNSLCHQFTELPHRMGIPMVERTNERTNEQLNERANNQQHN